MRADWAIVIGLTIANAAAFILLGLHERIPLFWIFSFGFTDLAVGSGLFATIFWVPRILAKDAREARILTYSFWLVIGSVFWVPSFLR